MCSSAQHNKVSFFLFFFLTPFTDLKDLFLIIGLHSLFCFIFSTMSGYLKLGQMLWNLKIRLLGNSLCENICPNCPSSFIPIPMGFPSFPEVLPVSSLFLPAASSDSLKVSRGELAPLNLNPKSLQQRGQGYSSHSCHPDC